VDGYPPPLQPCRGMRCTLGQTPARGRAVAQGHTRPRSPARRRAKRPRVARSPLRAYAPDLNPVEYLWANLKGVELANLLGATLVRPPTRPSVASNGCAQATL